MPDSKKQSTRPHMLLISYYYPPLGGGAVSRVTRLSKYLGAEGIDLTVLTVSDDYIYSAHRDESLLAAIMASNPSIRIERTGSWEPAGAARDRLREATSMKRPGAFSLGGMRAAVKNALLPDEKILWMSPAAAAARKIARERPPDVIYATAPPHSTAVIAARIARALRRPLIAEFRDDWIGSPLFDRPFPLGKIEKQMERSVVDAASKIVLVTESGRRLYLGKYPRREPADFVVVHNSFDPADFENLPATPPELETLFTDNRVIAHTGGLDDTRDPTPLISAIEKLDLEQPGSDVAFLQIGQVAPRYLERMRNSPAARRFRCVLHMEHRLCLACLAHADASVLIPSVNAPTAIPGKFYEYLKIGNPVLIIGENHSIGELAAEIPGCASVPADAEHIFKYLAAPPSPGAADNAMSQFSEKFSAIGAARRIAELIKTVSETSQL